MTISLCMIVRDEQQVLARCLDCAKQFVDEIVIVDTGSTDNTVEIARRYTDRVYPYPWQDDFAAARNFSFSKASGDYLLWLDADDIVDRENIRRIQELKQTMPGDVDVAMFLYNTGFDENGAVTFRYYRERLVRREKGYRWQEPVHEHLVLHGRIQQYAIAITHGAKPREGLSNRNLNIYQGILDRGEELSTRGLYYFARELFTHGKFSESIARYREFLARPDGWVEDRITAAGGLADCYFATGKPQLALRELMRSFAEDLPRAEILCRIGLYYFQREDWVRARYWYELALAAPKPDGWGFVAEDDWGFVPHLQLCVILDRQGDRESSFRHHLAARALKPQNSQVLHNQRYFSWEMDPTP